MDEENQTITDKASVETLGRLPMTKEEAIEFFSEIYGGAHHIQGEVKQFGDGWTVQNYNDLSTYDFNMLTRMVFLAHDKCYRLSIKQGAPSAVKVMIWKRHAREGKIYEMHPTIEQALEKWRESHRSA